MASFIKQLNPTHFITANFNRDTNWQAARQCLKRWHARIDRKLLGKHWSTRGRTARTLFISFGERPDTNLHWHMLLRLGSGADRAKFEAIAGEEWQQLVSSGSMKVDALQDFLSVEKTSTYATKDLWRNGHIENFIISTEFIPN